MPFRFTDDKPLYLQIYTQMEDAIFVGTFPEETQVPSTTEISAEYKINPATVLKGITMLVNDGILYKKRGIGMFVSPGAVAKIREKRQGEFFQNYVDALVSEAQKLQLSAEEVVNMIRKGYKNEH